MFSVGPDSIDTHRPAPAVSATPVACNAWDAPSLAVCCPEHSSKQSISALEVPSLHSANATTHIYTSYARSRNQQREP